MFLSEKFSNSSNCSSPEFGPPSVREFLRDLDDDGRYVWIAVWIVVAVTTLLFFDEFAYAMRKSSNYNVKKKIMCIRGLFMVYSWVCIIAITLPRASMLIDFAGSLYLSYVIYMFYALIVEYFGGRDCMVDRLSDTTGGIPLASPPVCCVLYPCVSKPPITWSNMRRLRLMILQNAVLRPVLCFVLLCVWANSGFSYGESTFRAVYMGQRGLLAVSMMVGMYGLIMLYRLGHEALGPGTHLRAKLFDLQLVMILTTFQPGLCSALVSLGIIPCLGRLDAYSVAAEVHHVALLCELLLVALLTRLCHGAHVLLSARLSRTSNLHTVEDLHQDGVLPRDVTKRYIFV